MSSDTGKIKNCPVCNTSFTCSPVDCWCAALPNIMTLDSAADCYCPQCLKAAIDNKLSNEEPVLTA